MTEVYINAVAHALGDQVENVEAAALRVANFSKCQDTVHAGHRDIKQDHRRPLLFD